MSEFKPCPFCGGEEVIKETSLDNTPYMVCQGCGCSVDGYIGTWNTRAVPDVPELVRYSAVKRYGREDVMEKDEHGEYVRYDQAAAIIAAKEDEVDQAIIEKWEMQERAEAAEAKLAQIKAQDPVAYLWQHPDHENDYAAADSGAHLTDEDKKYGWMETPLYSAPVASEAECFECEGELTVTCLRCNTPVDQTAEIERLREALKQIHAILEADRTGMFEGLKNIINVSLGDSNA